MGQLASRSAAAENVGEDEQLLLDVVPNPGSAQNLDPLHAFYVLNPEANLSFTQQTFEPLFQRLGSWQGVIGRMPTPQEVNTGFTDNDLFM